MCGIYKITNLINNKSYIGQSIDIQKRWKKHQSATDDFAIHQALRKYGVDNFEFSILEECEQSQLNEREIYWINVYNSIKYGYNMIPGGSNGSGIAKGKEVEKYSLSGEFLRRYRSANQASEDTGICHSDICKCCRGESLRAGKYLWKYTNSDKKIVPIIQTQVQRKVKQFTQDGVFLKQYESLAEAAKETGISKSTICKVCNGIGCTAGGFCWAYEESAPRLKKAKSGQKKAVIQYDLQGQYIQQFNSLTEASKITGISLQSISLACLGKQKTAGKYIWKFLD